MKRIKAMQVAIRLCEAVRELTGETEQMEETIGNLRAVARDVRYGGEWHGDKDKLAEELEECGSGTCLECHLRKIAGCRKALKEEAAAAIRQQARIIETLQAEVGRLKAEVDSMRGEAYDSDLASPEPAQWQKDMMAAMEAESDTLPY